MMGFQAAGAAPIVLGRVIEKPETVATAIKIGNPASWQSAVAARDESGGVIGRVIEKPETVATAIKIGNPDRRRSRGRSRSAIRRAGSRRSPRATNPEA